MTSGSTWAKAAAPWKPRVLLTVEVEDYFHVGRFDRVIPRERWYRFERRVEQNTRKALDLVEAFDARATFFVLGWVADNFPDLVREITDRGHEVASLGYDHRTIVEEKAKLALVDSHDTQHLARGGDFRRVFCRDQPVRPNQREREREIAMRH